MISSVEFEVLSMIKNCVSYAEYENQPELYTLRKEKLIEENVVGETYDSVLFDGYKLTSLGERAYEEYQAFLNTQQNEKATLEIAKEANALSEKSNNLSDESNKISKKSNKLSIGAIVISVGAIIVSVIDIVVNSCT